MRKAFANLLVSSPNGGGVFFLDGKGIFRLDNTNTTGLAVSQGVILRGEQPNSLWICDGQTGELNGITANISDIHDVLIFGEHYYVVGTKYNEIVKLDRSGREIRRWTFASLEDARHINCLGIWNERLVFSAFGEFNDSQTYKGRTSNAGYVQDLTSGERVITGLSQPHSLVAIGKNLVLANSEVGEIREYSSAGGLLRKKHLAGYTRGICVANGLIYVGLSRSRKTADESLDTATLLALDRKSWEEIGRIQLPVAEIYSVQHIKKPDELVGTVAVLASRVATKLDDAAAQLGKTERENEARTEDFNRAVADKEEKLNRLTALVSERDGRISELNKEVERRDSQIADLHRLIGERDALVDRLNQASAKTNTEIAEFHRAAQLYQAKIGNLNRTLIELNDQIKVLHKTAEERDRQIGDLRLTLQDKDAEIRRFELLAQEQVATIAATDRAVTESGLTIANLRLSIADHEQQLDQIKLALLAKDEEVGKILRALQHSETQVRDKEGALAEREARIVALDQAVSERENLMGGLRENLQDRDADVVRLNGMAREIEETLTRANLTLEERDRQIRGLQGELFKRDGELAELKNRLYYGEKQLDELFRSHSWKVTRPLRFISARLIRKPLQSVRAMASDTARLAWRRLPVSDSSKYKLKRFLFTTCPWLFGWSLAYRSWRAFHFSPVTNELLAEAPGEPTMQVPASSEFVPLFKGTPLAADTTKLISFYLPQFHPIPENDQWWGVGFTEWTNVKPAEPQFTGHDQPREPGELGYYNLLDTGVQRRQVELAKLYGIGGFCFYFYWFGGKRLLEQPIKNYLDDASLDLPFCLCWANENWSRRWDGLHNELLITQQHSLEDDLAFISHIASYMRDPRYIRVHGKPLLLVYRPSLLPDARATVHRWRQWCRNHGIGEIYLAYTQSFETVDPQVYGFDAAVEFPPNNSSPPVITDQVAPLNGNFDCIVYDWKIFVERSEKYVDPDYKLFRGVCPSWDNTARRKHQSSVFLNSNPKQYQRWLENAVRDTEKRFTSSDERLIFVNAWNEWAEGAYLEPDRRYGYAYLQATRNALSRGTVSARNACNNAVLIVTHDCHPHGAQFLILETARTLSACGFRTVILALDGGRLLTDFSLIGPTYDLKNKDKTEIAKILAGIRDEGIVDAITSTVVSGAIVPQLKDAGFRVLSLIHELPGIIRDMNQGTNAQHIARLADKVVFPAELVYTKFCDIAPVPRERVLIRPQGLLRRNPYKQHPEEAHRRVCEKHGLPQDTQIVLSVAYVDARKGADLFVEVAARVIAERRNTVFIWVGHADPSMERDVQTRIRELGLADRILFTGFDSNPMVYYAAASVYALTSREDPFPNVVLESAEAGVPVVAFEGASGATEFIEENGGELAVYLDIEDFAGKLLKLLAGPRRHSESKLGSLKHYALDLLHHLNGFPRVSVIVPNYNYAEHIQERLDTICHQALPIYELIVLDDASTDSSMNVINDYFANSLCEHELITNSVNSGSVFRQWCKGIEYCAGDLVWIAEADDAADTNFLCELTAAFHDPKVVMAYCQSKQVDSAGTMLAPDYLEYTKPISDAWTTDYVHVGKVEISEALCIKNTIPNVSAVVFRRDALLRALKEAGNELFDYKIAGDWLIYLHVLMQGDVHFNKNPLNLHRRHEASVTNVSQKLLHIHEVSRVQAVALALVKPPNYMVKKANSYIEYLYEYFGIEPALTEKRDHAG